MLSILVFRHFDTYIWPSHFKSTLHIVRYLYRVLPTSPDFPWVLSTFASICRGIQLCTTLFPRGTVYCATQLLAKPTIYSIQRGRLAMTSLARTTLAYRNGTTGTRKKETASKRLSFKDKSPFNQSHYTNVCVRPVSLWPFSLCPLMSVGPIFRSLRLLVHASVSLSVCLMFSF